MENSNAQELPPVDTVVEAAIMSPEHNIDLPTLPAHFEGDVAIDSKEDVFVLDPALLQKGNERALWEAAGRMVAAASADQNAAAEEAAKGEYDALLAENLEAAKSIQAEIDQEQAELATKYGAESEWSSGAKKQNKINSISWATGGILGLAALAAATPAEAGGLKDFAHNLRDQVNYEVAQAGNDAGAVVGGASRIVINRSVNSATAAVLRGLGVPVAQTPEEVVVLPRNNPNVGYGGVGMPLPQMGVPGRGQFQERPLSPREQEIKRARDSYDINYGLAVTYHAELAARIQAYEMNPSEGNRQLIGFAQSKYTEQLGKAQAAQATLNSVLRGR